MTHTQTEEEECLIPPSPVHQSIDSQLIVIEVLPNARCNLRLYA